MAVPPGRVRRLAVGAFVGLTIATIGAFFLIQHLKVVAPLINGFPAPVPNAINPVSGGTCLLRNSKGQLVPVSFRSTEVSFYLQNRAAVVDVDVVTPGGRFVARMQGSGRHMPLLHRRAFTWNGRKADGTVAPDGTYDIRVTLVNQAPPLIIANQRTGAVESLTIQTLPPRLTVTAVTPEPVVDATHPTVTIHYSGSDGIRPRVLILRAGRVLKNYAATTNAGATAWNGTLAGERPAPPGRYLVALSMTDRTCDRVSSPRSAALAPQAVVTVR
jgi:FlgD Ig-like domain